MASPKTDDRRRHRQTGQSVGMRHRRHERDCASCGHAHQMTSVFDRVGDRLDRVAEGERTRTVTVSGQRDGDDAVMALQGDTLWMPRTRPRPRPWTNTMVSMMRSYITNAHIATTCLTSGETEPVGRTRAAPDAFERRPETTTSSHRSATAPRIAEWIVRSIRAKSRRVSISSRRRISRSRAAPVSVKSEATFCPSSVSRTRRTRRSSGSSNLVTIPC